MEKETLIERVDKLEEIIKSLRKDTLEIKSTVKALKSIIEDFSQQFSEVTKKSTNFRGGSIGKLMESHSKVNPWTQEALNDVLDALESLKKKPPVEFSNETFGPTIDALKKGNGMTAKEVGEITGRKRNTESFYLKRLYLAGITKRWRRGRRVFYALTNDQRIHEKYSELLS